MTARSSRSRRLAAKLATLVVVVFAGAAAIPGLVAAEQPQLSANEPFDIDACSLIADGSPVLPAGVGAGVEITPLSDYEASEYSACKWSATADSMGAIGGAPLDFELIVVGHGLLDEQLFAAVAEGDLVATPLDELWTADKAPGMPPPVAATAYLAPAVDGEIANVAVRIDDVTIVCEVHSADLATGAVDVGRLCAPALSAATLDVAFSSVAEFTADHA